LVCREVDVTVREKQGEREAKQELAVSGIGRDPCDNRISLKGIRENVYNSLSLFRARRLDGDIPAVIGHVTSV
jgi:hypothetical protein